jgi:hypothetical protein
MAFAGLPPPRPRERMPLVFRTWAHRGHPRFSIDPKQIHVYIPTH